MTIDDKQHGPILLLSPFDMLPVPCSLSTIHGLTSGIEKHWMRKHRPGTGIVQWNNGSLQREGKLAENVKKYQGNTALGQNCDLHVL